LRRKNGKDERNEEIKLQVKAIPVIGRGGPYVFPVRYEYHLHITNKVIPVTGRGGQYVCFL
jgi:hypothetical protein